MDEIKLGTIDPKSLSALQVVSESLEQFIKYLKTVDPELEQFEATLLASVFLEKLPTIIQGNQTVLLGIKKQCEYIKQQRSS
jgi:hypothetical protein